MWHILSFEIVHNIKGPFLVWPLGCLFIVFQLGLLGFVFSLLVLHFCHANPVDGTLIYLNSTLSILESVCKNIPPNIRMITEANRI